jgi:hypothetical protein
MSIRLKIFWIIALIIVVFTVFEFAGILLIQNSTTGSMVIVQNNFMRTDISFLT